MNGRLVGDVTYGCSIVVCYVKLRQVDLVLLLRLCDGFNVSL